MKGNYPAPREIPPGKILIVGPMERGWEEATKEHAIVELLAEAPPNKRLRPSVYDNKVTLFWSSPGFEIGGSVLRWTNGYYAVHWRDRSYAIQGRRFRPDEEGEAKAREQFRKWTTEE